MKPRSAEWYRDWLASVDSAPQEVPAEELRHLIECALRIDALTRERDELREEKRELLKVYEVAKMTAIRMEDWPIESAFGEAGREYIDSLNDARKDYENWQSLTPRGIAESERLYEATKHMIPRKEKT